MENVNSLHIITRIIKGIQKKKKLLFIIEYFTNKIDKMEFYFYKKHI